MEPPGLNVKVGCWSGKKVPGKGHWEKGTIDLFPFTELSGTSTASTSEPMAATIDGDFHALPITIRGECNGTGTNAHGNPPEGPSTGKGIFGR